MADCHKLNVQYIPRVDGEIQHQWKVRRKKIRNEIRKIKNMSVDTAALQTEQLPSNSDVPETNMVVNATDIQTQELPSLHSNPKVVEAVKSLNLVSCVILSKHVLSVWKLNLFNRSCN